MRRDDQLAEIIGSLMQQRNEGGLDLREMTDEEFVQISQELIENGELSDKSAALMVFAHRRVHGAPSPPSGSIPVVQLDPTERDPKPEQPSRVRSMFRLIRGGAG